MNREKCVFSVPELVFFGFKISTNGIAPDDKKIDAVRNARPPQNAAEVRSFLGLVNYCARFIPNFATLAEPLRKLKGVMLSGLGVTHSKMHSTVLKVF